MKRYIFFIGTLRNGGAERVVSVLASQMGEQGYDTEIVMYYDRPIFYEISSKVKLTIAEKETGTRSKVKNLYWLRNYFKMNAKVVISFLAPFNIMAIAANLGSGTPIVVADRNDPRKVPSNYVVRKVRDFLYRFADGIVVQTEKNKSYFSSCVQKKSVVIYNPVDLKEYAGSGLSTVKEKKIVTAGRLMPQKNQAMMIRAFAEILKKHPEYELVIYGDGPSEKQLKSLVGELGILTKVFFPGNVKDLHNKIRSAEMFVLSSDYEGMPNALIEAMCLGLPCVSTEVSGATDLIIHGKNGMLTKLNDQQAFTEAILELIENPETAAQMCEEAVKLNEELKLSKIMEQWIVFIKTMVGEI